MSKKEGLVFFLFLFCFTNAFSVNPVKSKIDNWVDSVYNTLTYEQRIGQLIVAKNYDENTTFEIRNGDLPLGGVVLNEGKIKETYDIISDLESAARLPLWVIKDGEISIKNYFSELETFPGSMVKSAIADMEEVTRLENDESNIYKNLGVNLSANNGVYLDNINGEFVKRYRESSVLYAKTDQLIRLKQDVLSKNNIISALNLNLSFDDFDFVKYIPKDLYDKEEWKELKDDNPIIFLNGLDLNNNWSSDRFKKDIVNGLIRNKFEYEGVLVVDLENFVAQVTEGREFQHPAPEVIKAGIDLIITENPQLAYNFLIKAWKENDIRNGEIEDRVKNILRLKYLIKDTPNLAYTSKNAERAAFSPDVISDIYESYASAMTLVKNNDDLIPVSNLETRHFASLSLGTNQFTKFQETLDKYASFTHFVLPADQINAEAFNSLLMKLSAFDNVVVGIHGPFNEDMLPFLSALEFNTELITTLFDSHIPDNIGSVTNSLLITYENNDYTQEIAPQIIFGARPCKGVYSLSEHFNLLKGINTSTIDRLAYSRGSHAGIDENTLSKIEEIAREGISNGAMPGCQVLVARNGNIVYEKSFGYYTYDSIIPVNNRTIYDLASVTKVAATTQSIMFLVDQGVIKLSDKLSDHLPELEGTNKGDLIIHDVLTHQSGLKAFLPMWHQTIDMEKQGISVYSSEQDEEYNCEVGYGMYAHYSLKDSIYNWTIKSDLRRKPRYKKHLPYDYKYSDLGFYLLYKLAERKFNQPFDEFLAQNLYAPLGMSSTTYNPLCQMNFSNITPTEDDKSFRHALVWGSVHDQIAAMNGGVSGHAGLFGNSVDLAKLGQMHLQHGQYGGLKYYSPWVLDEFTTYQHKDSRRGLGWDKPDKTREYYPASRHASFKSYGHLGFTGTIVWVDPEFDLIYVFLSNRIYPDMTNNKLNELDIRTRIHDVVYESIFNFEQYLN